MTLEEIKEAVDAGKKVYWKSCIYEVIAGSRGGYLIMCTANQHSIGLTWTDGVTMNGKPEDFYSEDVPVDLGTAAKRVGDSIKNRELTLDAFACSSVLAAAFRVPKEVALDKIFGAASVK